MVKKITKRKKALNVKNEKSKNKASEKVSKSKSKKKIVLPKKKSVVKNTKAIKNTEKISSKKKKSTKKSIVLKKKKAVKKVQEEKLDKKVEEENENFAKWTAPEHIKTKEDLIFYYISILLSVIAITYFVFQGSFIPVLTFSMMLVVVLIHVIQQPHEIEYKINLEGISFNDKLYLYDDIQSFQVIQDDEFSLLKLNLKNSILSVKTIFLIDQDPLYIRAILDNFLFEEEIGESLMNFKKKDDLSEYISDDDIVKIIEDKEKNEKN